MKTTTLIVLGAAGVLGFVLFSDGKQKQTVQTALKKAGININFSSGVPVDIPKDPTKLVNQVDYYEKNPTESFWDSLFRSLP
ncbi:MAG: hypothetical protein ACTS9Y_13380 [Methylophilus sp.]|uniref:hypothetical protein n=1 Tax=Methylophilus sp. TaxID=29541 RepID=UPI003F9F0E7E